MYWDGVQLKTIVKLRHLTNGWRRLLLSTRADRLNPLLAAGLAFLVYSVTLARDLTWSNYGGDGGELIAASMTLGTAHPPGYPIYVLLGRLFALLPIGTIAARYSWFSAVAAAVAVGLLVHSITIRNRRLDSRAVNYGFAPLALGLALAFTPLIWRQAVIAEVYPLYLAFVALFIWALADGRSPLLIGLALGLAITSHLTGLLLVPLALWCIRRSDLARFTAGVVAGLSPFLLLPWLADGSSPVTWGDPSTLEGWWWLASARLYQPNGLALPVAQWPARVGDWIGSGVAIPLLLWLFLAIICVRRMGTGSLRQAGRQRFALSLAFLITGVLYCIYAFTYRTPDAAVLLLPGILLAAVAAGPWLMRIDRRVLWLLPLVMALLMVTSPNVKDNVPVRNAAAELLTGVPSGAVVLTPGDASIAGLWYFQHVEGWRQDLIIVDENMFQFEWYRSRLGRSYPELSVPDADDLLAFVGQNQPQYDICRLSLGDLNSRVCIGPHMEATFE